jgi:hypothetical protein
MKNSARNPPLVTPQMPRISKGCIPYRVKPFGHYPQKEKKKVTNSRALNEMVVGASIVASV